MSAHSKTDAERIQELAQALRVAERVLSIQEPNSPALILIRRTLKRDCPPLTFEGTGTQPILDPVAYVRALRRDNARARVHN